jgi:protein SCO1/2
MAYMNHRHGLIRQSVLGLQTLSNIVFAMALIMSQPSWAATSPVTIGGPFTLIAPDGTTVTDQTFRGKWLLVYFGYTFCPNICPMTLNEIATALEKLGADAVALPGPLDTQGNFGFARSLPSDAFCLLRQTKPR